jgi:molybdopterin-guanine dinucleotide biosynthesis adapter protein
MKNAPSLPPVLGFAAWSGTGKTTLLSRVLPLLRQAGLRVGVIKHAHHDFEIDTPGKDSYQLRKAGADHLLIASDRRWALLHDYPETREPRLESLLSILPRDQLDLVLVEGFRHLPFPRIELHRAATGQPLLFPGDPHIIAVASDCPLETTLPVLDLDSPEQVAGFIIARINADS